METLFIPRFKAPAHGTVRVPGSKSINNRALLLAALADGTSVLTGALESDDTLILANCLKALGFKVLYDREASTFEVTGYGGAFPKPPTKPVNLWVGNSGTSSRFLLALCGLNTLPVHFDGVPAMRKRPMGDLVSLLAAQGSDVVYEGDNGYFPLTLTGHGLPGGIMRIDPARSSQQVSAALMVAPYAKADTRIELIGTIVSEPYIAMTITMMEEWGVEVERPEPDVILVRSGQVYKAMPSYTIEPDASGASYFFAAAAVTGGQVTIPNLSRAALQGDALFVDALAQMGATIEDDARGLTVTGPAQLRGISVDMNAISDTAQTLAAIASNASSPTLITGVEHNRWKETDRVHAMATQLRAMGADLDERHDGLLIRPAKLKSAQVATYEDHRMAMSLAIAGLANEGVTIEDPACTSKTFPTFFDVLGQLRNQSSA